MQYSVLLVHRGISSNTHSVTGKSGRLYGHAVASPEHGGVSLLMSLEEYLANAHDIVGNNAPNQQWVPEFVAIQAKGGASHKCDRCQKPATATSDRFFFCDEHAPNDAMKLDGSGPMKASAAKPAPTQQPDTHQPVEERVSKPVEEHRELPQEHLPPPQIGTAREAGPGPKTEAGVVVLKEEPKPGDIAPNGAVTEPRGNPAVEPEQHPAVAIIAAAVVEKIIPKISEIVDEKLAAFRPPPQTSKKKSKPDKTHQAPSEFRQLQQRAAVLGINSFGKNTEQLRTAIAEKASENF
jgi:hypothetical protein